MTEHLLNPDVFQVARESRGRTQEEVGVAAGVTQGLISKVEKGAGTLQPREVAAVADFLDYPGRMFYEPGRVREVGSACLYHRKRKTLPAKVLRKLDARMYVRNINIRKLLDGLELEGNRMFHTLDPDEYGGSPVEVARALRTAWRLPEGPISNLTALIESAGGIVIAEDFGNHKLFGMSCWTTRGHPLFFLNSAIPTEDLRWTVAHELGHLTMHAAPSSGDPELEADAFAGEFLAPDSAFRPTVRGLAFDRLPNLKTYWRISMKGIITRAQAVGAINKQTAVRLYKQHSARGYNFAEPYALSSEPPTLVKTAIDVHLEDYDYSHKELAAAVLVNLDEFYTDFLGQVPPSEAPNVISLFDRPSAAANG
ncbi:MAG: XRE family transcriptional regulator [Solirubrobacteraceae bacterium MAG38_C4-C5]|nr:XRE family transcriptional regulator [Candidatus Siliceabacter maunaloa]